jgi:hypothetical protein
MAASKVSSAIGAISARRAGGGFGSAGGRDAFTVAARLEKVGWGSGFLVLRES